MKKNISHYCQLTTNACCLLFTVCCLLSIAPTGAHAQQCGIENTAFKSGERLSYDLYFNWKFVWMKVGHAQMNTDLITYEGKKAWRSDLVTGGNRKLDRFFTMRDTLVSVCSENLSPLYHRKGALEGKRYYVDELWYSYPNNTCKLKMHRIKTSGEHVWKDVRYRECIYDMMSIFMRARNFDASKMKVGDIIPMPVSDASSLNNAWLKFRGREKFKVEETKEEFKCLVFSFMEHDDGKNHELVRFFITDDQNHIPVRLDMFLSFGSAKAFLRSYKGVRSPMTSKISK